ncbi:hypothetical protein [Bacillus safensis]|uniref:hypothetical protein n=1 Tax=Bacillus safensis TaxID=561879 RepID=UPI00090B077E|nr:hypothetical protein [Bacillus safensis]APJ11131.1 hypothetical protein BSL056_09235 [Bacillus safensis]
MTFKRTWVVERHDQYTIELDENVLNEEWMQNFRETFYDFTTLTEHAEHIARTRSILGSAFIDGYGVPLENGQAPSWANKEDINEAINIIDGNASLTVNSY